MHTHKTDQLIIVDARWRALELDGCQSRAIKGWSEGLKWREGGHTLGRKEIGVGRDFKVRENAQLFFGRIWD